MRKMVRTKYEYKASKVVYDKINTMPFKYNIRYQTV